jgi:hypothetical protein
VLTEVIEAVAKYEIGWTCTRGGQISQNEVLVF